MGGAFAPAATLTNGVAVSVLIPLAGASRWRLRFKSSAPGSLACAYVRPDGTAYSSNNPSNVAVTADVETVMEVNEHFGEAQARLTFTPSGDGAMTYADLSQV